jgi:preprotein translocase subunit SecA
VLEYDEVVNEQRRVIYEQRRRVLQLDDLRDILLEMADDQLAELVTLHTQGFEDDWDLEGLHLTVRAFLPLEPGMDPAQWVRMKPAEIVAQLQDRSAAVYDQNREQVGKEITRQLVKETRRLDQLAAAESPPGFFAMLYSELKKRLPSAVWTELEVGLVGSLDRGKRDLIQDVIGKLMTHRRDRSILLRTVDTLWIRHLTDLDILREGIGLRAYAQQDPLVAFKKDAHEMYGALLAQIRQDVVSRAFLPITLRLVQRAVPRPRQELVTNREAADEARRPARKSKQTVGRNDPCPCGSGKKYKQCCMRKARAAGQATATRAGAGAAAPGAKPRKRRRRR